MLLIFTTEVTIKDQDPPPLPTNIFYYRDGVSEGEYDNVLAIEARAIQGKKNNSVVCLSS